MAEALTNTGRAAINAGMQRTELWLSSGLSLRVCV